jgi:cytochrome c biogenesis protein CcdA
MVEVFACVVAYEGAECLGKLLGSCVFNDAQFRGQAGVRVLHGIYDIAVRVQVLWLHLLIALVHTPDAFRRALMRVEVAHGWLWHGRDGVEGAGGTAGWDGIVKAR